MFHIEKFEMLNHVLYRDITGAVKHIGDQPFSDGGIDPSLQYVRGSHGVRITAKKLRPVWRLVIYGGDVVARELENFIISPGWSSKTPDVSKKVYESKVAVFNDEKLSTRSTGLTVERPNENLIYNVRVEKRNKVAMRRYLLRRTKTN
ncbi:unnamed protein product [Lupinus luteus]|uniref:Uncharacterized protein n=1 Tax=Lupinus luteus TaxID=3873 RepID=A0AAV1VRT2_LUPLU